MGQSRWLIAVVVVGLSFVLPVSMCLGIALVEPASVPGFAAGLLAAAVWLALLWLTNWWGFTTIRLRWVWVVALVLAAGSRVGALARGHISWIPTPLDVMALAALAIGLWLLAGALAARRHPGDALQLALPFASGRFLVADGGDGGHSFLVNYHYGFGRHRRSGVGRSMRYAMDIVEIGPGGGESRGLLPRRNDAWRIWERPLLAPCDGVVVHAESAVEDNAAFGADRPYGVGNHVVIRTDGDAYVVLGHVRCGSVTVAVGDGVRTRQVIGRVGNSGWTERPHLHMQAMRSADGDYWHGEPLPVRFGGRFPVRNEVLRA
jgi:Peptidase family M23